MTGEQEASPGNKKRWRMAFDTRNAGSLNVVYHSGWGAQKEISLRIPEPLREGFERRLEATGAPPEERHE